MQRLRIHHQPVVTKLLQRIRINQQQIKTIKINTFSHECIKIYYVHFKNRPIKIASKVHYKKKYTGILLNDTLSKNRHVTGQVSHY